MQKKVIIYLHGFNSASLDLAGDLLICKDKLRVMQTFCEQKEVSFYTPNIDYRDFEDLIEDMLFEWNQYLDQSYDVVFMGSSMGGFTSEYLAMKTGCKAIMINPAINPSSLLAQFIGVTENYETAAAYDWTQKHCDQYASYEKELSSSAQKINRTILIDRGDELIDAQKTLEKYQEKANVVCYDGGSHSFEHIDESLALIEGVIFSD